jgi:peptidoglycan hydrolase CwlO-like protein
LNSLTGRIKNIVNSIPESQKEVHAHCREEMKKNEQQIKALKSVVKKLDV